MRPDQLKTGVSAYSQTSEPNNIRNNNSNNPAHIHNIQDAISACIVYFETLLWPVLHFSCQSPQFQGCQVTLGPLLVSLASGLPFFAINVAEPLCPVKVTVML
jgi:hypothetical protein